MDDPLNQIQKGQYESALANLRRLQQSGANADAIQFAQDLVDYFEIALRTMGLNA